MANSRVAAQISYPISHIRLLSISCFGFTGPRWRGSSTPVGCFLKGRVLRARILYEVGCMIPCYCGSRLRAQGTRWVRSLRSAAIHRNFLFGDRLMKKPIIAISFLILFFNSPCLAENYVLVGQMGSEIRYELQQRITGGLDAQKVELRFVIPQTFESPTYRQEVHDGKRN